MAVTRDDVIAGFRLILGRDPDDEAAIAAHLQLRDPTELAAVLLRSAEFVRGPRFKDFLSVRRDFLPGARARFPHASRSALKVLLIGNCQVATVGQLMQAMTGDIVAEAVESTPSWLQRLDSGELDLEPLLADADLVYVQLIGPVIQRIQTRYPQHLPKLRYTLPINYSAFHPDCVYVKGDDGTHLQGPMGDYHSSIAFWAWQQGWSETEALALFRPEAYDLLGFDAHEASSRQVLIEYGQMAGVAMAPLIHGWKRAGTWMHTINHPTVGALAGLTAELLRNEGIDPMVELGALVEDSLAQFPVWPVYPPIAARLGVPGSYLFKVDRGACPPAQPRLALTLEDFVVASFARYREFEASRLSCARVQESAYQALATFRPETPATSVFGRLMRRTRRSVAASAAPATPNGRPVLVGSPYAALPDRQFWRRAMEQTAPAEVDPVGPVPWQITPTDKLATAGSCFAQHLSRTLSANGFHYFVTEAGEGLSAEERSARQFGVYSARYGNIYTARQLVQLIDRAYGRLTPSEQVWQRPDGRFVDPFRPQVKPGGFGAEPDVIAAAAGHLAAVRALFEQMDVFVFTLGLTEAWRHRGDGTVYPLAPGVAGGEFDPSVHEFVNFGVSEVTEDIRDAVRRLRRVNPRARFIFTVSPVPLIATYEDRHVLVSTVESKAVLRAAIAEAAAADPGIVYFPSYEVVTGMHARGRYFGPDLRSVTDEGVAHVMRLFMQHFTGAPSLPTGAAVQPAATEALMAEQRRLADLVCDEEAIERHRRTGS